MTGLFYLWHTLIRISPASRAPSDTLNPSLLCWTLPLSSSTFEMSSTSLLTSTETTRRHRGCNVPRYSLSINPRSMIASHEAEAISTISFNLLGWDSLVIDVLFDIYPLRITLIEFIDSFLPHYSTCLV